MDIFEKYRRPPGERKAPAADAAGHPQRAGLDVTLSPSRNIGSPICRLADLGKDPESLGLIDEIAKFGRTLPPWERLGVSLDHWLSGKSLSADCLRGQLGTAMLLGDVGIQVRIQRQRSHSGVSLDEDASLYLQMLGTAKGQDCLVMASIGTRPPPSVGEDRLSPYRSVATAKWNLRIDRMEVGSKEWTDALLGSFTSRGPWMCALLSSAAQFNEMAKRARDSLDRLGGGKSPESMAAALRGGTINGSSPMMDPLRFAFLTDRDARGGLTIEAASAAFRIGASGNPFERSLAVRPSALDLELIQRTLKQWRDADDRHREERARARRHDAAIARLDSYLAAQGRNDQVVAELVDEIRKGTAPSSVVPEKKKKKRTAGTLDAEALTMAHRWSNDGRTWTATDLARALKVDPSALTGRIPNSDRFRCPNFRKYWTDRQREADERRAELHSRLKGPKVHRTKKSLEN